MPSKKKINKTSRKKLSSVDSHILFFPVILLCLVLWYLYRALFAFPVWFDETIGKAIFFGLPVWFYASISATTSIGDSFSLKKAQVGLLLGLAVGGVFGFVTAIMSLIQRGGVVEAAPLFANTMFWYQFIMAIFTSFWETLFFYSFIMSVVLEKYQRWPFVWQLILVSGLFLLFHAPNAVLRFEPMAALAQMFLLAFFALGQALLYYGRRNAYSLVLSQAIWGMVLLVYGW